MRCPAGHRTRCPAPTAGPKLRPMPTTPSLLSELDALPARWAVQGTLAAPVTGVADLLFAVAEGRVGDDNLLVLARAAAARIGAMTVVATGAGAYRVELAGRVGPVL